MLMFISERTQTRLWLGCAWSAVLVATVTAIGDLSEPSGTDYAMEPWRFGRTITVTAVIASAIAGAWSVLALLLVRRMRTRLWRQAVVVFTGTAVIAGYCYRVMTAAVIGANIGAGMVILFGLPLIAFGVVQSKLMARRAHRL